MDFFPLIWLIPILPGLGAFINGVLGVRSFSKRAGSLLACATMGASAVIAVGAFLQIVSLSPEARVHDVRLMTWFTPMALETAAGIGTFSADWAFRLDPLSSMMCLVVTGIGLLIHIYASGYMMDEPRGAYVRFFCYLNLFCFFMLTLVLGANFLVMFVGWEGVGLCSYLLIGFWYEKKSAADAGKKAFIVNRIGDWGFILGIFLVFYTFGTIDFSVVAAKAALMPVEAAEWGVISLICVLLFIGATGKSAQIPLYIWLPDAMEGPTPVSALIHAATMVTAGVYMVGRNAVLFEHAPQVMQIVAVIGALTAIVAASIGLVQTDIKRVLAYSTVSQLGYMFLASGVGAFAAGAFHLMTHAFFKALLFLGSGSVIHAMGGEQDMRRMGNLRKYMPVTYITMLIGTLAIAGIPPFAGFFSKDEILYKTFLANKALWALAVVTAGMTAFYMFRLMSLTFFGTYRGQAWGGMDHVDNTDHADHAEHVHGHAAKPEHDVRHGPARHHQDHHQIHDHHHDEVAQGGHGHGQWHGPHESPRVMTVPLMILAAGAVVAGFVGIPTALGGGNAIEHFLHPSYTAPAASHGPTSVAADPSHAVAPEPAAPATSVSGTSVAAGASHTVGTEPAAPAASLSGAGVPAGHTAPAGEAAHLTPAQEIGLMAFSVLIAALAIAFAYHVYVRRPEISERLAQSLAGPHKLLTNKYYVDELYDATVVKGTMAGAFGSWAFDRAVVDGAVNGTGWLTLFSSWVSGLFDKYVVDGLVNLVGWICSEASYLFRRFQTGLIQNYALLMLFGVFAFVSLYLFVRR